MKLTQLLPVLTAVLIIIFFLLLPTLNQCRLPERLTDGETKKRGEHRFILVLTLLYAVAAFLFLGNTRAPQSFRSFHDDSAELRFDEPVHIDRVMFYAGIVSGELDVEISPDGENWLSATSFQIDHIAPLKWNELDWDGVSQGEVRALRIHGSEGTELLEVGIFSPEGELLTPSAAEKDTALCDEQALVPAHEDYMNSSYFDEIYHARTAWEHLRGIYPYEISHPPLGKIILSLGIAIFGMTPFGWRFMGTLVGVLMLPVMYWFARKLYGGKTVPACCAVLLATDFMHFAQTRIATIDSYAVLFTLLMYGFMFEWLQSGRRRDLRLSGIFFGIGAASKWTCLYAGAGLGVIWLVHWIGRLYAASRLGAGKKSRETLEREKLALYENIVQCILFFVIVPALIYYLSYIPYGIARHCVPFSPTYTKTVLENQSFMLRYHSHVNAEHPYSSRWYQWVLDIRPVLFYLRYRDNGMRQSFGTWLNPALCWAGLLSLFVLIYTAVFRRDRKAAFLLLGYLAQLLPWVFITRTVFEYHYFACSVFLVLSLGYVFSLMRENLKSWRRPVFALCALSTLVFVLFYPALTGIPVRGETASQFLKWLPAWPF